MALVWYDHSYQFSSAAVWSNMGRGNSSMVGREKSRWAQLRRTPQQHGGKILEPTVPWGTCRYRPICPAAGVVASMWANLAQLRWSEKGREGACRHRGLVVRSRSERPREEWESWQSCLCSTHGEEHGARMARCRLLGQRFYLSIASVSLQMYSYILLRSGCFGILLYPAASSLPAKRHPNIYTWLHICSLIRHFLPLPSCSFCLKVVIVIKR